jgi:hypothetical protein
VLQDRRIHNAQGTLLLVFRACDELGLVIRCAQHDEFEIELPYSIPPNVLQIIGVNCETESDQLIQFLNMLVESAINLTFDSASSSALVQFTSDETGFSNIVALWRALSLVMFQGRLLQAVLPHSGYYNLALPPSTPRPRTPVKQYQPLVQPRNRTVLGVVISGVKNVKIPKEVEVIAEADAHGTVVNNLSVRGG